MTHLIHPEYRVMIIVELVCAGRPQISAQYQSPYLESLNSTSCLYYCPVYFQFPFFMLILQKPKKLYIKINHPYS